jgi:hypothetical protein
MLQSQVLTRNTALHGNTASSEVQSHIPDSRVAVKTDKMNPMSRQVELTHAKLPRFDTKTVINTQLPIYGPLKYLAFNETYRGQYSNGVKCGQGEIIWEDGAYYIGQFDNDTMNGYGRMIYLDGESYEGDWIDGKRNGEGVLKYIDGTYYKGKLGLNIFDF